MNFSIFLTNKCNMNCKYCYETNKQNKSMSYEVLDKTIDFIINHYTNMIGYNERLSIVTHGGEPLLEFEKLKYLVNKINRSIENVEYIITTNATLLNDENVEFLITNFSQISVSIDGTKVAHDLNRVYVNGDGTYEHIIENVKKILAKRHDIKARLTINSKNVYYLYEGVKELIGIGFNDIVPVPDQFDNGWTEDSMAVLYSNGEKMISFIKNNNLTTNVGLINDALVKCRNSQCDGGTTTFSIDCDGTIYPCVVSVGAKEFVIGNLSSGIFTDQIDNIQRWANMDNIKCSGCSRYDYCYATRCKIINKLLTGDLHTPSAVTCNIENVKVSLARNYLTSFPQS